MILICPWESCTYNQGGKCQKGIVELVQLPNEAGSWLDCSDFKEE